MVTSSSSENYHHSSSNNMSAGEADEDNANVDLKTATTTTAAAATTWLAERADEGNTFAIWDQDSSWLPTAATTTNRLAELRRASS
jgi:hypothetical protein